MSLFIIAAWLVGIACVVMVGIGIYAIATGDTAARPIPQYTGVCAPSRARMLTGANLSLDQLTAIQQDSEELQRQAAEIEELHDQLHVMRLQLLQRNRMIKRLRAEREQQPVEQAQPAVAVGTVERFANLEIRGQSR